MNRTIKFRMWDHFNEEMTYSENDLVKFFTKYNLLVEGKNDPVLMQFTGLLDKNGKEIYEGDVVKFTMGDEERICVVEYKNGGFMVESDGFFGLDEFDVTTIGFAFDEMDETIVVGNIHDNPELLEDKA